MTAYGNFETTTQVFKTHHGSIWAARTAGTEELADCSVKLLELNPTMLAERDTTLAKNLLVSAALQQAMGNKSEFWAPVYGLGSHGTNSFYVSRLYPRSVQTLIENSYALNAAELKIILLGTIDGLMDLQTAFHRTHGNLKPSNVLLDDASKIHEGGIYLCDPDASTEQVPSLVRTPDTKAIGEMLYALVTHRPHTTARWPLPKSDKWKELGSTGKQWMALCDSLLNTVSRRGMPTLEHLRHQIEAIQPTRRRTPRAVFALLALAALAAGGYAKRDQLPGWYKQASDKVASLIPSKTKPSAARPRGSNATTAPGHPLVANVPTNTATKPPLPLPGNTLVTTRPEPTTNPAGLPNPVPPVVSVRTPPISSPVIPASQPEQVATVLPPPALVPPKPVPTAPPIVSASSQAEALNTVRGTASPEFHSDAAKTEFIQNRDRFAAAHSSATSDAILSDWAKILSITQGMEADYPPVDASTTTGWPVGLASVIRARRDAMLVRAIDSAFAQQHADPSAFQSTLQHVQAAATAVVAVHDAGARGDLPGTEKSIAQFTVALQALSQSDADLIELFGPVKKEFSAYDDVANSTDRASLLSIADSESAPLALRLSAWLHAGSSPTEPWPTTFAALAADQTRASRLDTLLQEAGSIEIAKLISNSESDRQAMFFGKLRDQAAVLAALKEANDPKYATLLEKSPTWFRYDAALYVLRTTLPTQITEPQKKKYADLSAQVDAPGVQLVHDVLKAAEQPALPLSKSGPGSVAGWQLRSGSNRDHCTYIFSGISSGGISLEFLRVHVPDDSDGIDCYLSTTEAPVALVQQLLKGDLTTAEALNKPIAPLKDGMRLWAFNDSAKTVDLDEDNYRKCFVVSPTDQLPAQMLTPQAAFYLSRRAGCRLPTSKEWTAAYAMAKNSSNSNLKGFATVGWKLRDREFAKLLSNPNRDADCWPDDNIFLSDLPRSKVQWQANAAIWNSAALATLGAQSSADTPLLWPLSTLQSSNGLGFRSVGDGENFAGVFHNLIGNVAEYVMDSPVVLAEKVAVTSPLDSKEIVHRVSDWFSPAHQAQIAVIGGSALSPPELDPTKPLPLPRDQSAFADVGFRLAFTDPVSLPNAQRSVIDQALYLTAP